MLKVIGIIGFIILIDIHCNRRIDDKTISHENNPSLNSYYFNLFMNGTSDTRRKVYYRNFATYEVITSFMNNNYLTTITIDSTKKNFVKKIKGTLLNNLYGHYFEFYDNGNINKYYYYTGKGSVYDYGRTYAEDGSLIKEEGNPFVDQICNGDSCKLFFSTVFYSNITVQVSTDEGVSYPLSLRQSNFQPLLYETEIATNDAELLLNLVCHNKDKDETIVFQDTLRLK